MLTQAIVGVSHLMWSWGWLLVVAVVLLVYLYLRWSKSPLAPAALCGIARHALTGERSARWLRRLGVGKKPVPADEAGAGSPVTWSPE